MHNITPSPAGYVSYLCGDAYVGAWPAARMWCDAAGSLLRLALKPGPRHSRVGLTLQPYEVGVAAGVLDGS